MRAGLLPKQLKTQCLKDPRKISFLKNESIETFFVEDILFDSSLKLETRFTLETTMKSGTQTKKNREKKFRGNIAKVGLPETPDIRHLPCKVPIYQMD